MFSLDTKFTLLIHISRVQIQSQVVLLLARVPKLEVFPLFYTRINLDTYYSTSIKRQWTGPAISPSPLIKLRSFVLPPTQILYPLFLSGLCSTCGKQGQESKHNISLSGGLTTIILS